MPRPGGGWFGTIPCTQSIVRSLAHGRRSLLGAATASLPRA